MYLVFDSFFCQVCATTYISFTFDPQDSSLRKQSNREFLLGQVYLPKYLSGILNRMILC